MTLLSRVAVMLLGTFTVAPGERALSRLDQPPYNPPLVTIDAQPLVDIGGLANDGTPIIKWALSAVRAGNRIVVVDQGSHFLLLFDMAGHLVRAIRNGGSKPGNFDLLSWVGRCGDKTVSVFDDYLARVTEFDLSGSYIRHFRAPPFTQRVACSPGGTYAFMSIPTRRPYRSWTLEQASAPIQMVDSAGEYMNSVPAVASSEARPAGRRTSIALSSDRMFVGTAETRNVMTFDLKANRSSNVDVATQPRPMTRTAYEVIVTDQLSRAVVTDSIRAIALQAPIPKYHPFYEDVHATADGALWVTISARSDSVTTLRVIDASGHIIGDVRLPHLANVLDVSDDYVLAEYRSPVGLEHVALYQVHIRR